MIHAFGLVARPSSPWSDINPVRAELFGIERLELHAKSLARAQLVSPAAPRVLALRRRLGQNATALEASRRGCLSELAAGRSVVPAACWLLDNFHRVDAQIRAARSDLPPSYYRILPKLASGPFRGYPRIFEAVWAYVSHCDSRLDAAALTRFLRAYQLEQPLTVGELWAVPITLRLVLIENLRRLADQIVRGQARRRDADALADRVLAGRRGAVLPEPSEVAVGDPLSELFAAQLAKRLRDSDPQTTPMIGWLEDRLSAQGSSVDLVVRHAQERQGASNVSVRNAVTALRALTEIDWPDLVEAVSLVDARLRRHPGFAAMDFASRTLYRAAVEELARHGDLDERAVAEAALEAAAAAADPALPAAECQRRTDPGWHLLAEGRPAFERRVGCHPPGVRGLGLRPSPIGYAAIVGTVGLALLVLAAWGLVTLGTGFGAAVLWSLAALIPASCAAQLLVDRVVVRVMAPAPLPALALDAGVPVELRTLVVVPALLTDPDELRALLARLEVHHLSGAEGEVCFALLTDGQDSPVCTAPDDVGLLALVDEGIAALNLRYGAAPCGPRFLHLHRQRRWNPAMGVWMGWERKRGKLAELNRLLRGATDTDYRTPDGVSPIVPPDVRFVLTLDSDTVVPREAALRLIGKMAHPLNRAVLDNTTGRVRTGHAILQPRITPMLPQAGLGTAYQRATSGPGGMDPYAAAASDPYQDLFGQGSFTGKGLYDIDAFETAMSGRVLENTLLSHDLLEGIFARAALASDVELVEAFPDRYELAARRAHRWCRGDWQLLPWLGRGGGLDALGTIKVVDTLRRSLQPPALLATLAVGWAMPWPAAVLATALTLLALWLVPFLQVVLAILPARRGLDLRNHARLLREDVGLGCLQSLLAITLLADAAWRTLDAVGRTLWRLCVSRRHLLEWTTAAEQAAGPRSGIVRQALGMVPGMALGASLALIAAWTHPSLWPLILPFAFLWLIAPLVAAASGRPERTRADASTRPDDAQALRLIARRTWAYFSTFVTATDGHLPPDNLQEGPRPTLAHRTSPTNIGLYLLATVSARDFGWICLTEACDRIAATLGAVQALPRHRGHLFNWYDTRDGRVLDPPYVSSVDSGNLAGHLIALANALEDWAWSPGPAVQSCSRGLIDLLDLDREDAARTGAIPDAARSDTLRQLREGILQAAPNWQFLLRLASKALGSTPADGGPDWLGELHAALARAAAPEPGPTPDELRALAKTARDFAMGMDFGFLLDPERRLLSIGYSLHENSLDVSCYDLLASEARLASLFAIAKRDVPLRHWFRLGRAAAPLRGGPALVSWAGSMFEYLMPQLVAIEPAGSMLGRTCQLVVDRQIAYAKGKDVPWGISESGFNARDVEFTYQYSTFGVPGLGLKRGLAGDLVIAPYATGLAAMLDPAAARRNFDAMAALGGLGRYGFHEALDFTPERVLPGQRVEVVKSYMAHHQGMTIVAIANALTGGLMRDRFHREPMIRASELLLQERLPREIERALPLVEPALTLAATEEERGRRVVGRPDGPPVSHLMSNGRYAVMLTASGGGYSRWGDIAITRWREDATRDPYGAILHIRDLVDGTEQAFGPHGARPHASDRTGRDAQFFEDHATFTQRSGRLESVLDVLVSGEADAEVRRLSITNTGRRSRELDVTSYVELTLAPPGAEAAHPAFSRLFVQTDYLPEYGALIAWRRKRAPDEVGVWVGQFAVIEGTASAPQQHDTDRDTAFGRDRPQHQPRAVTDPTDLAGRTGTVLDPVFALRSRVLVGPGRTARVVTWTLVAESRAALIDLIDRHHDRSAFDRARTLAWTQAQVELRHLGITHAEAADFQRLAAPILYHDARFRAVPAALVSGAGRQSGLWQLSISGDLPIALLSIDDPADITQVRTLLAAHEYLRNKQLAMDLVILNEHPASYVSELQSAIDTALRSSHSRQRGEARLARGTVFTLRADLMDVETRDRLVAAARVVVLARRGEIGAQIARVLEGGGPSTAAVARPQPPTPEPGPAIDGAAFEFFNGFGGFDRDGREYVIQLGPGEATPAPWINVLANPDFGCQVSASGSGFVWSGNSRDNQLTPWSNDATADPPGEAVYVRDDETGALISPTLRPVRATGRHVVRHGFGVSRFRREDAGLACEMEVFVPRAEPVRVTILTLTNYGPVPRRVTVASYAEPVMGTSRADSAPFLVSGHDAGTGALTMRNPWNTAFPGRVMVAAFSPDAGDTGWTGDRVEFVGRRGSLADPEGLRATHLSGRVGAGLDPCLALTRAVTVPSGGTAQVVMLLGEAADESAALALIARIGAADPQAELAAVEAHWAETLSSLKVETPDRAFDIMVNGWLPYQAQACRIEARAAFYQASGAYGFRDQLQDTMAFTLTRPAETRAHLLRVAGRQFPEGDVQHWWLPHSGQGVRTRISDDCVWLGHAVAAYVTATGDAEVLDEQVPFLDGPALAPGQHDAFFLPEDAGISATLFEHCARGLERALARTGRHGLPLIGTGDWNDGMNRVGEGGAGESVWLGWLLAQTLSAFAPLAQARDPRRAARWRTGGAALEVALEATAWDGAWYRRATFDDGQWLGGAGAPACQIDAIAQSWAVLSGRGDPVRAAQAMAAYDRQLVDRDAGIARLFTPPFDGIVAGKDPGYIAAYPPGLRENGGQYSHAAIWAILAWARLGRGDRAVELFGLLNPINHARTPEGAARYRTEPYAIAADVYATEPHVGRGGWSWYTGSAAWMHRAAVEGILGVTRQGAWLHLAPAIPNDWHGFTVKARVAGTDCLLRVRRGDRPEVTLDGSVQPAGAEAALPLDGGRHELVVQLAQRLPAGSRQV